MASKSTSTRMEMYTRVSRTAPFNFMSGFPHHLPADREPIHLYCIKGDFRRSERHGRGRYTWTDGCVYDGEWRNNRQKGQGLMTFRNGNVYEGQFSDNNPDGQGVLKTRNGEWNRRAGTRKRLLLI